MTTAQRGDFERPTSPQPGNRDERWCTCEMGGGEPHFHHQQIDTYIAPPAGQDTERLRDELHDLLLAHQRLGISVCGCGGMRLGESYPHHLIDALLDGPLRQLIAEREELADALTIVRLARDNTVAERDEARAQVREVEALADSYPLGSDVPVYRIRRALDGQP